MFTGHTNICPTAGIEPAAVASRPRHRGRRLKFILTLTRIAFEHHTFGILNFHSRTFDNLNNMLISTLAHYISTDV